MEQAMDHYQAADAIDANLRAGAVDEYVDGDQALEWLGDLVKLHMQPSEQDEGLQAHLRRVDTDVGARLAAIIDKIRELNVGFVMEAAAEQKQHARSDYLELVTERSAA